MAFFWTSKKPLFHFQCENGTCKIWMYEKPMTVKLKLKKFSPLIFAGDDNDADEEEGHNNEEHDKNISSEKEKLEDVSQMSNSSETANGEITIPILRRNGPLLQSQ